MPKKLSDQICLPCRSNVPPLNKKEIMHLLNELSNNWSVSDDDHHLKKTFLLSNFVDALALTNKIGELAEQVGHHPNIYLTWGKVEVRIWTHKINGLHHSDFILAAKIDTLL